VVIFGNVNITTPVIHYLLLEGIDCVFCSSTGRYHGRLFSNESKFGLLRQSQFQAVNNPATRLTMAIRFVSGKLANQRTMLMRYLRETPLPELASTVESLGETLDNITRAKDLGSLQGMEGYAGIVYFNAFRRLLKQDLGFRARVRRPPRDPVNSMLSFGYTLLVYTVQAAIRTVGLDPFLGFLHATEYSRPSLALDLMEEFRPLIVDSIVLRLVNTNTLTARHFEQPADAGGMVRLNAEAMRIFIQQFEERMQTEIKHPLTGYQVTYRRCLELQVRQLARVITGQSSEYKPFLVK
jgi:CRISPR-associated protein Cas1